MTMEIRETQHETPLEKRKISRRKLGELNNTILRDVLGVKYSKRPDVETTYVRPTLLDVAHAIWETPAGHKIYLGPKMAASEEVLQSLQEANVVGIVNCTIRVPCHHRPALSYCQVPVHDESAAEILSYLTGATTFLHAILQRGSVLVHCEQGVSRSATVVLAYLMRYHKKTRDEAYVFCKTKRPMINPNPGFWNQLEIYQTSLKADELTPRLYTLEDCHEATFRDWISRSQPLVATCREVPQVLLADPSWQLLSIVCKDRSTILRFMSTCLDYLWGRGVLDVDVDWLLLVCRQCPDNRPLSPYQAIQDVLGDPDSDFCQAWAGEIYSEQLDRVVNKCLQANQKHTNTNT